MLKGILCRVKYELEKEELLCDRDWQEEDVWYYIQNINFFNNVIAFWGKTEVTVIVTFDLKCIPVDPQIQFSQGENIYSTPTLLHTFFSLCRIIVFFLWSLCGHNVWCCTCVCMHRFFLPFYVILMYLCLNRYILENCYEWKINKREVRS